MSDAKVFLERVRIENFLSLRDVTLPLKPLTVLVGPNASGKSNVLEALSLLKTMMIRENLPPNGFIHDLLWAGEENNIKFQLYTDVNGSPTRYKLMLKSGKEELSVDEELSINQVEVISIRSGEGIVRDEDDQNKTTYKSNKLALKSASDYGKKPITGDLTGFLKGWEFYDFSPESMRRALSKIGKAIFDEFKESQGTLQLDDDGSTLSSLLSYWHEQEPVRFMNVSDSLRDCTNISIDQCDFKGDKQLCLREGYDKPIPLERASEGTLRLIAYFILLNEPELPPLIAIEEPERNLHPAALTEIANVLERIAEHSQVIITTHSSQLLDAFSSESLSGSLGVLLLRNRPGIGTEVIDLEDIRHERKSLEGWIADFGIGSGIFESALLQDIV